MKTPEQIKNIEYLIVQGDTNTALACANVAFLNKIKLLHIENFTSLNNLLSFDQKFELYLINMLLLNYC